MIIPEWLFLEPVENHFKNIYNPKSLKQIARKNIRLDDEQINKEVAKKMPDLFYSTDRALKVGFKINLDRLHINLANSKLTILPNYSGFGIKIIYNNKNPKRNGYYLR